MQGVLQIDRDAVRDQEPLHHVARGRELTATSLNLAAQLLHRAEVRHIRLGLDDQPLPATYEVTVLSRAADQVSGVPVAEAVLVGMRPEIAQSLVALGTELEGISTAANLQQALRHQLA